MPDGSWYTDEDEPTPILPDYNQSAFELAKILMPRFNDLETMELMCKALHVRNETEEIRQALILRENGSFLFIIGKALCGCYLEPKYETVTVWFGVDDLVVLLAGAEICFSDAAPGQSEELGDNKEPILAFLNSRVCQEWGSSFGMLQSEDDVERNEESGKPSSRLNSYRLRSVHSSWKRGSDDAASSDTEEASNNFKTLVL
ncbi:hypothetical protein B5807_11344 [Epicoccum nigrum]|uniref:Uncharacterized protein n=1 Tax=Epicoccum nigrum TaxID=105696 RepID=A0A1Y2LJM2_EPING|nr:hypothetical protein B5807_11344 [Epicoccum nigrum]